MVARITGRPKDKVVVDPNRRLILEWDSYFSRLESRMAELEGAILGGGVSSFEGRTGVVVSANGDYTASEVTNVPAGNIAAVTVQAALDELDTEKAIAARQIISGAGLTGGGDLSADRTLAVGAGTGITVNADDVALDTTSTRNTDHAAVTLTAGAGLTGGGDISSNRSFAVGAGTGITVNADDVAISAGGVDTTQLADDGVTDAKLDDMPAWSFKVRNAGTSGDPSSAALADITEDAAPAAGDFVLGFLSSGEIRKYDVDNLPGGGGGGGINVGTSQATTSGSTVDFTSLPSGINRITVLFSGVSLSGTNDIVVQLGDSGGIETTGYASASAGITGTNVCSLATSTAGFNVRGGNAGRAYSGQMVISRITGNTWAATHALGSSASGIAVSGGGNKSLSADLDRVRITVESADTFDAGSVNIFYEA